MRATAVQHAALSVIELPEPVPGRGQLLLEVLRCGICGSDLHARHHADEQADVLAEAGYDGFMRADQQVVLGHEFSGRVLEHGPGSRRTHQTGTNVTALPLRRVGDEVHAIGLSASAPGAYAERVVVQESLVPAAPVKPKRVAAPKAPAKPEKPEPVVAICPTCFMALPATGVCDNCG